MEKTTLPTVGVEILGLPPEWEIRVINFAGAEMPTGDEYGRTKPFEPFHGGQPVTVYVAMRPRNDK